MNIKNVKNYSSDEIKAIRQSFLKMMAELKEMEVLMNSYQPFVDAMDSKLYKLEKRAK
jgi:NifU-like protein involved in Fe-S cluster formation